MSNALEFKVKMRCGNYTCKNKLKLVATMEGYDTPPGYIDIERVPTQQHIFRISDTAIDAAGWKNDRYRGLVCPGCASADGA